MAKTKTKSNKLDTPEKIEAHKKDQLEFELKQLRQGYYSEPTVIYKVGDEVHHGCIKKSTVTRVEDGGKFLLLHEVVIENNYGKPYEHERDMWIAWCEVSHGRSLEENKKLPELYDRNEMRIHFMNSPLSSLLSNKYYFGVNFEPDYQRGNVWTIDDKIKLIDSVFNSVDIGKFVFIKLPFKENSPAYEVLDGKQRMIALVEFYEGRFTYKGMKYREMSWYDQDCFRNHPIAIGEVNEEISLSQKYKYFLRLNTGGKLQDPEHLKRVEEMYKEAVKKGL